MHFPYDHGYAACPCFWGKQPGRLVLELSRLLPSWRGLSVLDLGCGEGKNAVFAATRGAIVRAIDASALALRNAVALWPAIPNIAWEHADVRHVPLSPNTYDIVIAYGLLHCLGSASEVRRLTATIQRATTVGGFNALCAFNSRRQDLSAHPGFDPVLLPHNDYAHLYTEWQLLHLTDADLYETHPHNNIPHTHSMTRLLARKHTP